MVKDKIAWLIKIILSLLGLGFVLTKVDIITQFKAIPLAGVYWFVLALAGYVLSKYLTAIRYNYLLKSYDCELPIKYSIKLYLVGMYYNLILPGGVSGDFYKGYIIHKNYDVSYKDMVKVSLQDRIFGTFAILILIATLLSFSISNRAYYPYFFSFIIVISASYYAASMFFARNTIKVFYRCMLISLLGQIIQLFVFISLLRIFTPTLNWVEYGGVFMVSSLLAALPVTIGGVGIREMTFFYLASRLQLNVELAVTCSMLFYLITVLSALAGLPLSWSIKETKPMPQV